MNKIITLTLALLISACGGKSIEKTPPAPPAPTITTVEFCQIVTDSICTSAEKCAGIPKEQCMAAMAAQLPPCEHWTPDNICGPGEVYVGERAYDCAQDMPNKTCEDSGVPASCEVTYYCQPASS